MWHRFLKLDWLTIVAILLLIGLGTLILYSLFSDSEFSLKSPFVKQVVFISIGLILMFFFALADYHYLQSYSRMIYFFTILVLLMVLIFGIKARGTVGWLGFGFLNFQPVEFAKLSVIVLLASFISKKKHELSENVRLFASSIMVAIIALLVLRQPDLGSALVIISIWVGMILVSGIRKRNFFIILFLGLVVIFSSWFYLADYQKSRVLNLFNPESDPRGTGYNVIQSITAVGSGGITGKGIGHGSQSQLNFLPEKHTDFIFAVITEELGIAGSFFVLFLYLAILYRMKRIAVLAADNFGYLLVSGVMLMLFSQIVVNVGMNVGILPVTGIPLPLLSYGGSSLLAVLVSLGIVLNVESRKSITDHKFIDSY